MAFSLMHSVSAMPLHYSVIAVTYQSDRSILSVQKNSEAGVNAAASERQCTIGENRVVMMICSFIDYNKT